MKAVTASSFLSEKVKEWSSATPHQKALVGFGDKFLTYQDLENELQKFDGSFSALGVRAFDFIGVFCPRSLESAVLLLALLRNSAVGLSFEKRMTLPEMKELIGSLPFQGLIMAAEDFDFFQPLFTDLKISVLKNKLGQGLIFLKLPFSPAEVLRRKNIRWALMTSGSTGKQKAVLISEENLLARTKGEVQLFGLKSGDLILNCLTFTHDLGFNQILSTIYSGATLRLISSLSPAELVRQMGLEPFVGMTGTPRVWKNLLEAHENGSDVTQLNPKYLTISGGSVTPEEMDLLRRLLPKTTWIRTYGQTETFRTLATKSSEGFDLGRTIEGVTVSLLNSDGDECTAGEAGELYHLGDGEMAGYFLDEELTKTKLGKSGIATGDYFSKDTNGNFHFLGRRDEMAKKNDQRFFLSETENALMGSPEVSLAAVIQVPLKDGIGRIVAYVLPKGKACPTVQSLKSFCQGRISSYKIPDEILILPELPRTQSGKVDKGRLKSFYLENLNAAVNH